jgi:organic radical activating enzyme
MKKLRLLLFTDCDRNCPGCCNKDWDLDALPECTSYEGYDEIMITGGEPLLKPALVRDVISQIRQQNPVARIYIYTAKLFPASAAMEILEMVDGMTVTLHEQADVKQWVFFHAGIPDDLFFWRSLRLNVFKGIDLQVGDGGWSTKYNLEWRKDCPLPADEVFMRHSTSHEGGRI